MVRIKEKVEYAKKHGLSGAKKQDLLDLLEQEWKIGIEAITTDKGAD